jgi:hypothetical protein
MEDSRTAARGAAPTSKPFVLQGWAFRFPEDQDTAHLRVPLGSLISGRSAIVHDTGTETGLKHSLSLQS